MCVCACVCVCVCVHRIGITHFVLSLLASMLELCSLAVSLLT